MSSNEPRSSATTSEAGPQTQMPSQTEALRPRDDGGAALVPSPARVVVESVSPEIDAGRFAIKRVVGERVDVAADVFADGHDTLSCWLLYRSEGDEEWTQAAMERGHRDRWRAHFIVSKGGRWSYTVRAWPNPWATWLDALNAKLADNQDVDVDLRIGAGILRDTAQRLDDATSDARRLRNAATDLESDVPIEKRAELARDSTLRALVEATPDPNHITTYGRRLSVLVEREKARFSTWYELFPRSCTSEPGRHGTLHDVEERLPAIAKMGFDVLYLPPIHPIGRTHRKGRNNTTQALPSDPGSPWAIGATEGGHDSVHPQLGTLEDFGRLVERARDCGIEIAMDLAYQCSPDHPWVQEHPEWFRTRPDGSVQYAENPPKKYEDILPLDFDTPEWQSLWEALAGVVEFWCRCGVRIFRVDNPHTKPFSFWEWLIERVRTQYPDVLLLAEAFTRPRVMHRLAKVGFSQSYTYFTWRNTKAELQDYLTELTTPPVSDYFRSNFWPNTPDILPEALQFGDRPAFIARLVLAATMSSNYGIYGPAFELCEQNPREPGSEEYLRSEKYEIHAWDLERAGNIRDVVERLNAIRRNNPALQGMRNLKFHDIDNEQLIAFSKHTDDHSNVVVVVVNLDPHRMQSGWLRLPLDELGIAPARPFQAHDLIAGKRNVWSGERNFVRLDPAENPASVFEILRHVRDEKDFEYYG